MTENEKLVRDETEAIECLKSNKPTSGYLMLQESIDMAIKALEEVQQYRELTDRLKAIYGDQMTLKDMVDVMERIIREPGRKDPVNARILTYDEAAMWDEYRKIGTVEECRAAMEKQRKKLVKNQYGTSYIWKAGYWSKSFYPVRSKMPPVSPSSSAALSQQSRFRMSHRVRT